LARYIRQHSADYKRLEGPRPKRKEKPRRKAEREPRKLDPVAVGIPELPHWARVAFAARCARLVYPYFNHLWPDAWPNRSSAVQKAIRLAEQAAATGKATDVLKTAAMNAGVTAGAALAISLSRYRMEDAEPGPPDGNAAVMVSSVAEAAVNAVEAARYPPERSADFALDAYAFARDIAWELNPVLVDRMAADFRALRSAARRGRWTDQMPVPAAAFTASGAESET
jgi:hypothetical protein